MSKVDGRTFMSLAPEDAIDEGSCEDGKLPSMGRELSQPAATVVSRSPEPA